ncbi:MAG: S9 family peptidase [Candidatus Kapaibacterium sp.]
MSSFAKQVIFLLLLILSAVTVISQDKELTLESIYFDDEFTPEGAGTYNSMKDGNYYSSIDEDKNINIYDYETGSLKTKVMDGSSFIAATGKEKIEIKDYKFSSDESKILVSADIEKIYRTSFVADYYVWDVKTGKTTKITKDAKARYAELSPDGNKVLYIQNNNIYIYNISDGKITQVTKDGKKNSIINGISDWVYEEELGLSKAFSWSADSKFIAYMKFDESKVKEMNLTFYNDLYPSEFSYKYPKAGEENSVVTVWSYDLENGKTVRIDVGSNTDQYIPRIKFTPDNHTLSIIRLNRLQNKLEILFSDALSGKTNVVFIEEAKYYISESYDLTFLKDGRFIRMSDRDGFAHIYLHEKNGQVKNQVTKGNYDVSEIKGADEEAGTVYYTAFSADGIEKNFFVINFDGSEKKQLSYKDGFNNVSFSSELKYYILSHSDANTPGFYELKRKDGTLVKMLEDNHAVVDKMKEYNFVQTELFKFNTSGNVELNGWIMKPHNIQADKKYPVLIYVYGGPGSQSVKNSYDGFGNPWHQMLCQKGYIVACVDGRGTGARGTEFEKQVYGKMGKLELIDQIEGAKYLASLPYVDKDRIGIWGWSFGGYMSALAITAGADYFKTAVSVAPVTNFRYYDNIYTERYLGLPKDNPSGYDDNSPISHADKLKGNLLIVHGSTDDNVHYQNTMEFTDALIKADKQFEMQIYPNRNHNIGGGNTRYHLFKRITEYLLRNL